ncbi:MULTISPECIES: aldo/keto reductase [Coprobacillaceae]|uniref:aldo/keto reductase n=1 Tax=Coprobacillaceae TaxID=2810280 RepID=UPI000E528A73|nr:MULTISPECIES: aldo/keto reductase [Coprobacillaceae]RHM61877.1 aldo/keto reductase [Coprobacillus sp. AF33-1AC]RHS94696.1 aldo/keto reductase [Erysipelatoclostridium sp. AM42-17]
MNQDTKVLLNDGHRMPIIALGVWQSQEDTKKAVLDALKAGYRHIDTAFVYDNERAVGEAIRESGIPRNEIFVTTKLWNDDIRSYKIREALKTSLDNLGLDYVDLYLIHWPAEGYVEAYLEMEKLQKEGLIRSIGVSNFRKSHLENLLSQVHIIPSINQIETNPQMVDEETIQFCKENKIVVEAWSPLGSGACLSIPAIQILANKYHKSLAQVILRWLLQKGIVVLPKSIHENRIIENMNIFDFELTHEEMNLMNQLNQHKRTGPDPDCFNF